MSSRHEDSLLQSFLKGALSGTVSSVLLQPLDMVKTRVQAAGPGITIRLHCSTILRQEGVLAFWRGLAPTLVRTVPGVGLYFSSLHQLQSLLLPRPQGATPSPTQSLLLGCGARSIAGTLLIPVTVVKTRVESGLFNYQGGVLGALARLCREEGWRGLTSGLLPTLLRDVPFSGLYLLLYTQLKIRTSSDRAVPAATTTAPAATTTAPAVETTAPAVTTTAPADTTSEFPATTTDAAATAPTTTANPAATVAVPAVVIPAVVFPAVVVNFWCGLLAGAGACCITQPFDMVKTRVQIGSAESLGASGRAIYRAEGVPGFFRGLWPRLIRRSLMAAITWAVYENVALRSSLLRTSSTNS